MIIRNRFVTSIIEKTVHESGSGYYSGNQETRKCANSSIILRIICIVFCTILLFGGNSNSTSIDTQILTNINESSNLYSYKEFHRIIHISIVANETSYDITCLQITEETTWDVRFKHYDDFLYILQDVSFQIVIKILRYLIVNLYDITWSKRRKKRILGK